MNEVSDDSSVDDSGRLETEIETGTGPPGPAAAESTGDGSQLQAARPMARLRATATSLRLRAQAAAADPAESVSSPRPAGPAAPVSADAQVSRLLQQAAAWAWRLLLVAIVIYFAFRMASALRLVVLPFIAALLLTALLQPLTSRLRRAGMPSLAATWCTLLTAIVILAGLGILTANRVSADYPQLAAEVRHTAGEVQAYLAGPPFHINGARVQQYSNQLVSFLVQHKQDVAGTVLTGGKILLEVSTGLILTIFITFFLLKDGRRIWGFVVSGLRPDARRRADNAGAAAWQALVNYIRGTTLVAAIHALFIGVALWILGVPLLVPLTILVFLAAFVPLIGILVVGALAVLVTLATKGWIAAVILVAVFLLENQIESHLLQPLVVGRLVRLHPLGIILVLAVGGIVAGIPGAIIAVPTAAVIFYAWPYLRQDEHPEPEPEPPVAG
jgi:predicted PurR-regulated permease PerM